MPPSEDVAVVIVTHETCGDVLACLDTLDMTGTEVVVVDCGSLDDTVPAVRAAWPQVRVLALDNVGYGRAANAGVAQTFAPLVLIGNADTRFAPDTLTVLRSAFADNSDLAAVGPQVRYPDGRPQASARTFPTLGQAAVHAVLGLWWPANRWTRTYRQADADPTLPRDVDWVSGCAIMLRRTAFADVGGFDPGYWMYVEDVDLGFRLRQAGWRVRFEPRALVQHTVGASTSQRRTRMVIAHAQSLDRFAQRAYGQGLGQAAQPLVRSGLLVWVALVLAWNRLVARRTGASTTGE